MATFRDRHHAPTVSDGIEAFLRRCEARNLSPHTISFYKYRLDAFRRYLATQTTDTTALADLTPTVFRGFLAAQAREISALTAHHSYVIRT